MFIPLFYSMHHYFHWCLRAHSPSKQAYLSLICSTVLSNDSAVIYGTTKFLPIWPVWLNGILRSSAVIQTGSAVISSIIIVWLRYILQRYTSTVNGVSFPHPSNKLAEKERETSPTSPLLQHKRLRLIEIDWVALSQGPHFWRITWKVTQ